MFQHKKSTIRFGMVDFLSKGADQARCNCNQTLQVQPKGSGFVPHWMPVSSS